MGTNCRATGPANSGIANAISGGSYAHSALGVAAQAAVSGAEEATQALAEVAFLPLGLVLSVGQGAAQAHADIGNGVPTTTAVKAATASGAAPIAGGAIGAALGSLIGPEGTVAGGAVGVFLGNLFGPSITRQVESSGPHC